MPQACLPMHAPTSRGTCWLRTCSTRPRWVSRSAGPMEELCGQIRCWTGSLGYPEDELLGRELNELFRPDDVLALQHSYRRVLSDETVVRPQVELRRNALACLTEPWVQTVRIAESVSRQVAGQPSAIPARTTPARTDRGRIRAPATPIVHHWMRDHRTSGVMIDLRPAFAWSSGTLRRSDRTIGVPGSGEGYGSPGQR